MIYRRSLASELRAFLFITSFTGNKEENKISNKADVIGEYS